MKTYDLSCQTEALLKGAFDLHIHPAPSPFNRALDDFQLLKSAESAGMAGILLKSHYESTAARAKIANKYADSVVRTYGAIVLNQPVGGLNPYAVHNALKRGARMVFMPTRDAANSLESGEMPGDFFHREGITVLDSSGVLKSTVFEIMDIVKQYGATLATGHLSPSESCLLCREGIRRGVRMVLTHPEFPRTRIPMQIQQELAQSGVIIEKCWYNIAERECTAAEMAAAIRMVGAQHCYMSTDRGQAGRELPVEGMKKFILAMLEEGVSPDSIYLMTHDVPAVVLGEPSPLRKHSQSEQTERELYDK